MKRIFWLGIICGLYSCGSNKSNVNAKAPEVAARINQVVGIGRIQPEQGVIQLASEVNGIVKKIYKKENDTVNAGDLVLELNHAVDDAKVMQLQKQIATQAAQVKADETAVQEYQVRYQNAATELARLQNLEAKGAETQQDVDNARTNMKVYASNRQKLSDMVSVSKDQLAEDKAELEVALQQRDQKFIKAPVKGTIIEMDPQPGSAVNAQVPFAQLSPDSPLIALCEIDELFAAKVHDGQKAWVRNPGAADTLATGTVYFTASYLRQKSLFTDEAGEKEDRRVREIKIRLDHPKNLFINSRVECVIDVNNNSQK